MSHQVATRPKQTAESTKAPPSSSIRPRAFIMGVAIIPIDTYWIIMAEKIHPGPFFTTISLFANVVFILAVLTGVNALFRKLNPRQALTTAELLLIYAMVAIGAALCGHDMMPNLVGMMGHVWRNQSSYQNYIPYLPTWLGVTDPAALKGLYEGSSSLYVDGHWLAWLKPCTYWLAFIVTLMFVMMCINTLVRKQWTERERLTFPIVQLPLSMTEPTGAIWRNRLFWIGFAIAAGIDLVNGLALYFPALPSFNVGVMNHSLSDGLPKPWNAMGFMPYSFYPFVIGLGYLLPTDLSFSCWFFYIFWKLQLVFGSATGLTDGIGFPFPKHQQLGGYIGVTIALLWSGKPYLKQLWLKLIGEKSELDDSTEPMRYRSAVAGAVIGFLFLAFFMTRIGLSPWLAVLSFVLYFLLATAIARMRAELGPPIHDIYYSGPDSILPTSFGLDRLSNHDLTSLTYFFWFNRAQRSHPMPIGIEGMKMAQVTKASQRKFFWGMMLAVVVGVIAAFWVHLDLGYRLGLTTSRCFLGTGFGGISYRNIDNWWSRPSNLAKPDWGANMAMLAGFAFTLFLTLMRSRVFGWPFHPIGYAISGSVSMGLVWVPLMIAWAVKTVTLRYGGLKLFKTLVPLFLGLILGEMIMGCTWSLIGLIFHVPYYVFWEAWF